MEVPWFAILGGDKLGSTHEDLSEMYSVVGCSIQERKENWYYDTGSTTIGVNDETQGPPSSLNRSLHEPRERKEGLFLDLQLGIFSLYTRGCSSCSGPKL